MERTKDGPEGDSLIIKLEAVEVGTDADGDAITSCVVVPVDGEPPRSVTNRRLSDRQRLALEALTDCAADHGKSPPGSFSLPSGLLAVQLTQWRDELFARGVLDRDSKNPREAFRQIKQSLQARHLIGVRDELVWRA